ncbi:cytochrome P450 [Aspergillus brunneoviolaceus CBS 621.78]|uniref:Cytochrome P450 n=1 Tax=Aspergillus brunneoviolaceus CBS 621.78 TaxID=1450534 RepID=A0ACD1GPS7_9EURO|nr:cytochrome P450 [Aspergillus brunneoviolaceus CBS 621.78]RAH51212.1 cytochrome P450 [Aspergillus brunneoviolaceus CBS 621.78]
MLETFFSGLASISTANLVSSAVICTALYLAGVAVYRLYLSPISHFPGPRLAALTWAYEFYYDWVLPGKYYERVAEMHRQYGSIVRVTPDELHILDPLYYDGVYVTAATRRTDVPYDFGLGTGFHDIARNAQSHDDHRGNYRFLKAFFSRASITRLEGLTTERLDRLDARLREWVDAAEPVNLTYAMYSYVTGESVGYIISSMLFEEPCDFLSDPGFNGSWFEKLKHGMVNVPLFAFMPWLPRIIALPLVSYLFDREKRWAVFDERTQRQQMTRRDRPSDATSTRSGKTLFDELVRQNQTKVPFDADVCREVAQVRLDGSPFNQKNKKRKNERKNERKKSSKKVQS